MIMRERASRTQFLKSDSSLDLRHKVRDMWSSSASEGGTERHIVGRRTEEKTATTTNSRTPWHSQGQTTG